MGLLLSYQQPKNITMTFYEVFDYVFKATIAAIAIGGGRKVFPWLTERIKLARDSYSQFESMNGSLTQLISAQAEMNVKLDNLDTNYVSLTGTVRVLSDKIDLAGNKIDEHSNIIQDLKSNYVKMGEQIEIILNGEKA